METAQAPTSPPAQNGRPIVAGGRRRAAGWGRRIGAYLIDRAAIYGVTIGLSVGYIWEKMTLWVEDVVNLLYTQDSLAEADTWELLYEVVVNVPIGEILGMIAYVLLLFIAVSGLYTIPQVAIWSKTLGKRICGIEIVGADDGQRPVGWWMSIKRWALPGITIAAGTPGALVSTGSQLWAFVQPERRGWHDLVAGTVVVETGTHFGSGDAQPAGGEEPGETAEEARGV